MSSSQMLESPVRHELTVMLAGVSYRVQRPWGEFDAEGGMVSDVAVDRRGHVYVLLRRDPLVDRPGDAVVELSPEGRRISSWGRDVIADGHLMTCSHDGRILVVDRDSHQIVIFDQDRNVCGRLGRRGVPHDPFNHPSGVALAPGGDILVSDGYANSRVHRFAPSGEWQACWGTYGIGPGQFIVPHAVWVLSDGRTAIADRDNGRIQLFTPDGGLLDIWTGFARPMAIWGDAEDRLYITDQVPSLTMLSSSGEVLGRCRPVLNGAHGVCGDPLSGAIYLAESNPSRITRLERL